MYKQILVTHLFIAIKCHLKSRVFLRMLFQSPVDIRLSPFMDRKIKKPFQSHLMLVQCAQITFLSAIQRNTLLFIIYLSSQFYYIYIVLSQVPIKFFVFNTVRCFIQFADFVPISQYVSKKATVEQTDIKKPVDRRSFSKMVNEEKLPTIQDPNDIRIELVTERDGEEVLTLLKKFFFKVSEMFDRFFCFWCGIVEVRR